MKVLQLFGTYVPEMTEGISKNVHHLTEALARQGTHVRLEGYRTRLDELNRRLIHVRRGWMLRKRLGPALRDDGYDVVHYHVGVPGSAALARFRHRRRARGSLIVQPWNAIFEPSENPGWSRHPDAWSHLLVNGPLLTQAALGAADAVVVPSRFQAAQLQRIGIRPPVRVVPNGVDPSRYRPADPEARTLARRRFGLHGETVVLYYGHLSRWKGLHVLLAALPGFLHAHPKADVLLSVTQYGGDADRVRERVRALGAQGRVHVLGPQDVRELHAAADVAVLPQTAAVGTACHPNVLLECMAAGVAVVASRVASIPEVVRDGHNGILVDANRPDQLAQAMAALCDDDATRRLLARAARTTIEADFTWDVVARRLRTEYQWIRDQATPAPGRTLPLPRPSAPRGSS